MPDMTSVSEMPLQQVSAAAVNPPHRRPKPEMPSGDHDGQLSRELSMVTSMALSKSSSSESTSSSTSILKRPLSNKSVENNKIKKIRLTEKNHIKEQLGISISTSTNHNKEDDSNLLATKIDQVTQSEKNNDSQIPNITFSEKLMEGSKNDATLNHNNDSNCDNRFYDKNIVKSPRINTSILATVLENDRSNILNKSAPVLSQIAQNSPATSVNSDNKLVNENNSVLNRSSPKQLVILENSGNKDNLTTVDKQTPIRNNSSNFNPTISETTSVQQSVSVNNTKKSVEPQNNTKLDTNIDNANDKTKELSDNDDDVMEVFDSDSDEDLSDESEFIESIVIDEILEGIKRFLTDSNFTHLMRLFNKKDIPFEQFESFMLQKILEFLTDKSERGKQRAMIDSFLRKEQEWRNKFKIITLQQKELKSIVKMHVEDMKKNPSAKPHVITRTVGLQAVLCPKKEIGGVRLSKTLLPAVQQLKNDCVSVISDDDDEIISIYPTTDQQQSCAKTNDNTTPKKSSSSPSKATTNKDVPTAVPVDGDLATCIDLTDDVVDVPVPNNKVNLTKSPIKTSPRLNLNTSVSQGSLSPILTKSSSTLAVPASTVTYIASNIVTSSPSSLIMRTSIAPSSEQPISSNLTTTNRSLVISANARPTPGFVKMVKDGQGPFTLLPVRQVHPMHPIAFARQVPATQLSNLTPVTQLSNLAPVPPSCPIIINHPGPLPNVITQKNLPTWKKLPPAPMLTAKPAEGANSNALLLSWNLALNKSIATIVSYQIFAYHETQSSTPSTDLWKRIGDVNALPLPMACSLTQFTKGEKYYFAVRAVDIHSRVGPFSIPKVIILS